MESGTIEQTLPGLEGMTPQPDLEVGRAIALAPQKRLMLFAGRSNPDLAHRIAEQLDIELGRVKLKTFANGETYCRYEESIRGADMFIVQSGVRPGRPQPDGAADHDQRGAAGVGEADHGGRPLVLLRAPGQEVAAARADQRASGRRHAAVRRRRPRAHDGPPRRPGAGLLPHPGRPHDGDPALRPVRPGSEAPGAYRRGLARHRPDEARRQVRGDDRRASSSSSTRSARSSRSLG